MAISLKVKARKLNSSEKQEVKKKTEGETFKALEKKAKTLFSRVNKRIRNLERWTMQGRIISPALNALKKQGKSRFGTKGTYSDLESLKKEIAKAQAFDNMETSSIKGARSYTENLKKKIPNVTKLNDEQINLIFDALHSVHERMPINLYSGLIVYSDYLDAVIEEETEMTQSSMQSYDDRLNRLIDNVIEKLTRGVTDTIDSGIGILSKGFDRLF